MNTPTQARTHTHTQTHTHTYMYYIYIYKEREREREIASNVCAIPALGTKVKLLTFMPNIYSSAYSTYVYVWVTVRYGIYAVLC